MKCKICNKSEATEELMKIQVCNPCKVSEEAERQADKDPAEGLDASGL